MSYHLTVYCVSDIGLIRQNNEDCWRALKEEQFFALADGMGGHQAGEIASKEAIDSLYTLFQKNSEAFRLDIIHAQQYLQQIIQEVNVNVYQMGRSHLGWKGMGTTLCCVWLHPEGLIYAHVGDSRIYRLRRQQLQQLTRDHSLLRELIDLGQLSEQQAAEFTYKNIITKAIGTEAYVEPTVAYTNIESNDLILMCTDGLSDLVSRCEIEDILNHHSEESAVTLLVNKAKERGGYDNITIVVIKVNAPLS